MRVWWDDLSARDRQLIANCELYVAGDPAGLPGHQLMVIIARLAGKLDEQQYGTIEARLVTVSEKTGPGAA